MLLKGTWFILKGIGYIRGAIGAVRDGLLGEKLRSSSTPGLLPVFKPEQLLFYFFYILGST